MLLKPSESQQNGTFHRIVWLGLYCSCLFEHSNKHRSHVKAGGKDIPKIITAMQELSAGGGARYHQHRTC